jgi:hypothetical protein
MRAVSLEATRRQAWAMGSQFASPFSSHAHREGTQRPRTLNGVADVLAVARSGEPDHYVAGLTEGFNLAREYRLVPVVIADGRKNGSIRRERDGCPAASFAAETSDDLGGKML